MVSRTRYFYLDFGIGYEGVIEGSFWKYDIKRAMISVNSSNTMVTIISSFGTLKAMSNRVIRIIDMIVIMIMVILSFR